MKINSPLSTIDFQAIFESSPDLYLILNPKFEIIAVSENYLKATHVERKNILGRGIFDVFPDNPDDLTASGVKNLRASLERVLQNKIPDAMAVQKYDIRRPESEGGDFEVRYWSPINSPVLGKNNEVLYIIHRVEDVTEFMHLKQLETEEHKIAEELRSRTVQMEIEIYQRAQEIQETNEQLRSANEELAHEEKEQEKLNRKLEKLNQLKTQFFANVSHELRTPLALILGTLERLLVDETLKPHIQSLQVMERNARALLKIVNDLLDVAKLEAGKLAVNYAHIDLANLLRQITDLFEIYITEHHVKFLLETPPSMAAELDPDKIQRVLMNLLSNAFKFTPTNGTVRCSLTRIGTQAKIIISDSGPGIHPKLREAVFERFFQIEESSTRRYGGTGLGLAIVKDFLELHGGSIAIEDSPEGGTEFIIHLPLIAPPNIFVQDDFEGSAVLNEEIVPQIINELLHKDQPRHQPHLATSLSDKSKPLILVVEDNIDMNQHISEILASEYRIINAYDGEEGLQKTLEFYPDLILTDIMMPKMNGVQFLNQLKKYNELNNILIIILTAKADEELGTKLLIEGAQDYLPKPFSQFELRARVANLIRFKKTKDELIKKNSELHSIINQLKTSQ